MERDLKKMRLAELVETSRTIESRQKFLLGHNNNIIIRAIVVIYAFHVLIENRLEQSTLAIP